MAQSKLEKIGTIFTRVQALLRTGAMKPENKPLWYDIYEAFPPKYEPQFGRKSPDVPIRQIYYKEDIIRAKFYKDVPKVRVINLNNRTVTDCQNFLARYEMNKQNMKSASDEEIYAATLNEFTENSNKVWTRLEPRYTVDIEELYKD